MMFFWPLRRELFDVPASYVVGGKHPRLVTLENRIYARPFFGCKWCMLEGLDEAYHRRPSFDMNELNICELKTCHSTAYRTGIDHDLGVVWD